MKYHGTYSCGHEGTVNIVGPTKDRQWKIDREFSGLCPDCYQKQIEEERAAENEAAEREAEEMELPELSGSPKQVVWANTIRVALLKELGDEISRAAEERECAVELFNAFGDYLKIRLSDLQEVEDILIQKTEARFWIDRRGWKFIRYAEEAYRELKESKKNAIPEEVRQEMEKEEAALTVEPESREKDGIVVISVKAGRIGVRYPKNDDFRKIVKSLGYAWGEVWCKKITEYSGPETDRIAELGNKLLANGFAVRFPDKASMDMAVSGSFSPECTRWVKYNPQKKKLAVTWKGYDDDLYQAARKLSGAKWNRDTGSMMVPVEFYSEVLDFAKTMGFRISNRAEEEIESFKEKAAGFVKANVKEAVSEEKDAKEELRKQLEKAGVIEDLKDEA